LKHAAILLAGGLLAAAVALRSKFFETTLDRAKP